MRDYIIGFNRNTRAGEVIEGGTKNKGFSYKTSRSLMENIISKKEPTLFTELEEFKGVSVSPSVQEYRDKRGKRVSVSPFQLKMITAFAQIVDTTLEQEGVKDYVRKLPSHIEDRELGEDGKTYGRLPNSLKCVIDIPKLTKLIYSRDRVGGKQTDKVRDELTKLSEILQVFKFKDSRGGSLIIEAPIITLGKRVKYETKEGVVKLNKVEVCFEDVFVYEINDKYSLSPITLLNLWNETGVQTELFTMLLFLLQNVRGNFLSHAKESVEAKRRELIKDKVETEEIKRQLRELKKAALTYKESIGSILERIDSKKYYVKGKYIHAAKVEADLKQAEEALLHIGIISEYYETAGATGEKVCNFVISDTWLTDEANRLKSLFPEAETAPQENERIETDEA